MGDVKNSNIEKALSKVPAKLLRNWTLELTSRCNLRCTYCSVPHAEEYGMVDMSAERIEKLKSLMKNSGVDFISLSGRGELTYIDGWEEIVTPFFEMGLPTHTVTNFQKPLTWEQARLMACFSMLTFSIDNVDREMTRKVRKGGDLRNVIYNVNMVKAAGLAMGRKQMNMHVIAVVTKSSLGGFKDLAALMVSLGVQHLKLQDLVMDYSDRVDTVDISHISELPDDELVDAAQDLVDARQICLENGVGFYMHPSLETIINKALGHSQKDEIVADRVTTTNVGDHMRHGCRLEEGETRDCIQPWQLAILLADGGVEPCTGSYGPIGNYDFAEKPDEFFNSPDMVELRKSLLTGNLGQACKFCGTAKAIKVEDFQKKVQNYIRERLTT
ncbi:hypothetical protein MTBPR1_70124 [Candidatus Terasakiella magnetica]|uniref:Radical SAM core domain-containing protein n=1 Tax=Candidatus Terasakiella magnetica TaxID=1867952 RepID=A0A1C3RKK4_9PROT|nr:radical SAM/SPASM domain-containing protein [Candidatus Terasakiella magnetica]SCA57852.1 hypothetical protein MTBPR1_70124 [Candidatus Terasakiella magnetica]